MSKIAPIIRQKLPSFVTSLYPEFTEFVMSYFDSLEHDGRVINEITNFIDNTDSTNESAKYWDKILADLSWHLNTDFKVDKRLFVTFVRHYYMSRGTAKSIEFLFKLLYNTKPKIIYPRDKLLIPSNSEYTSNTTMYLKNTASMSLLRRMQELAQNFGLVGTGITSGSLMIVDNVDLLEGKIRLFISTSDTFTPHESIELSGSNFKHIFENVPVFDIIPVKAKNPVTEYNFNVGNIPLSITSIDNGYIKDYVIKNAGSGYVVGDYIVDIYNSGVYAEVTEVSDNGSIEKIKIFSTGTPSSKPHTLNIISTTGVGAVIESVSDDKLGRPLQVSSTSPIFKEFEHNNIEFKFTKNAVHNSPKYWKNDNHILESNAVIIDSNFYHNYSYQIESNISRSEYEHIVQENEHPPGYVLFSKLKIELKDKLKGDVMNKAFLGFLFGSVVSNLAQKQYVIWTTNTNYKIGDLVINDGNLYIATSNGLSGYIAPTNTTGRFNDGGVQWQFVQSFNKDLQVISNLYLALSLNDNTFYAKRIPHTGIRLGAKYENLVIGENVKSNTLYKTDDNLIFYCVSGDKVCENSPFEANTNTMSIDGIVWRFVGKIGSNDAEFITTDYIPLQISNKEIIKNEIISAEVLGQIGKFETIDETTYNKDLPYEISFTLNPDGQISNAFVSVPAYANNSEPHFVHIVKQNSLGSGAKANAVISDGRITDISIVENGIDYTNGATVIIVGDGTNAVVKANIDSLGAITGFTIENAGENYTNADIHILPGESGAVVKLNTIEVSPTSMLHNLKADAIIFNVDIVDVDGYLESDARYNKISILTNASKGQHPHIGTGGENKIDKNYSVLWDKNVDDTQRSSGQNEKILIAITLE